MDDFELRERPRVVFEKPANELEFFRTSIPEATYAYLREKDMAHLSLGELMHRWRWTQHISPAMREHTAFFDGLPAMQRAASFYRGHAEAYNDDLASYTRFFSSEFLGLLSDRGWGSLSFSDLAHRFYYFSPFDSEIFARKREFEMIRRIGLFQAIEDSPLNIPMVHIVEDDAWSFGLETRQQLLAVLKHRGLEKIFDIFIVFGSHVHPNYIFDYPDLIPYDRFFERVFHCATEFLTHALDGHDQLPEGDWFGDRFSMEKNTKRVHKKSHSIRDISDRSIVSLVSVLIVFQIIGILGVLDYTSKEPRVVRRDISTKLLRIMDSYFQRFQSLFE